MIPVIIMTITFFSLLLVFALIPDRPKPIVPAKEATKNAVLDDAVRMTAERQNQSMVTDATKAASTSGSYWGGNS